MRTDELAFFNQQLAAMLREGIPLEGAVHQLSAGMSKGRFRDELQLLDADLAKGRPIGDALEGRNLPDFYKKMVLAGVTSNDLPGMLTLLADHYQRVGSLSLRLKGLMLYPVMVIAAAFLLALLVGSIFRGMLDSSFALFEPPNKSLLLAFMWVSPTLLGIAGLTLCGLITIPKLRAWGRWRLPGFREASVAQFASSMELMLKGGSSLPDSLAMAEKLESDTPAARPLAAWKSEIAQGKGKMSDWTDETGILPPLLLWLVKSSGENPSAGFQKAAELFKTRAAYRTDLLLYGALPVSVLLLGQMIIWQAFPIIQSLIWFMNALGSVS